MRLTLFLGAAALAVSAAAASAQPETAHRTHVFVHSAGGMEANVDADSDGWITRAEAAAAADRAFDRLDRNNDGRLDGADRTALTELRFDIEELDGVAPPHPEIDFDDEDCTTTIDPPGASEDEARSVRIVCESEDGRRVMERVQTHGSHDEARVEERVRRAEERARQSAERAERLAERAERRAEDAARRAEEAERHHEDVERHVRVVRLRGDAPEAPHAPRAPHAPMFMMLFANSDESDLNGDGAISREEFRAQHLRFFDASDANGDGRIRHSGLSWTEAPQPPEPPAPPAPPVRR